MKDMEKTMEELSDVCGYLFAEYMESPKSEKESAYNRFLCVNNALNLLKEQQEQKHGHWVSVPDKSPKTTTINMHSFIYSCSECGKAVGHHAEYNYCPGCGAIMTWMVNQDD